MEMLCISIQLGFMNTILSTIINTNAVAAYTAGMRVILFGIVPAVGPGISYSEGASYGEKIFKSKVFQYGTKLGILIGLT